MTETPAAASRIDRLFLFAFVPAFLFFAAGMYVRFTTDEDPLWSELGAPLLFALLGLRVVLRPTTPELQKTSRWVGFLLIFVSVVLAALVIHNSLGAR
jgi:hypothetical protein